MQRLTIELLGSRRLNNLAKIHHRHSISEILNHREIVRDEEKGQAQLLLEFRQQIDDLCLN